MSFIDRVRDAWDVVVVMASVLWWVAGALVVILLFVEFLLGIDFIAWVVGDPIGDIQSWIRGMGEGAREAVKEKFDRIEDSRKNR